jgi:hypothetical protein
MQSDNIPSNGLKVFSFWNGRMEEAPAVVKAATESWREGCLLAGFEYHIINESNLDKWEASMGADGDKLKHFREHGRYLPDHKWRKYSDMLRLLLLKQFNGIWVDATLMLMKPLNEWIPDPEKFGGLQLPKGSGIMEMESWLLISLKPCPFVSDWADQFADYSIRVNEDAAQWKMRRFSVPWWMHRFSSKIRGWSHHWFSEWFIRFYPRSPYYAIYYSFSLMWKRVSHIHGMQKFKVFLPYSLDAWSSFNSRQKPDWKLEDIDPALLESLESLPFLKLDWKRSPKKELCDLPENSVIRYLWSLSLAPSARG